MNNDIILALEGAAGILADLAATSVELSGAANRRARQFARSTKLSRNIRQPRRRFSALLRLPRPPAAHIDCDPGRSARR